VKHIWLDVANAGTDVIVQLLRTQRERAQRFETAEETSALILSIAENAIASAPARWSMGAR
jgi:hypothetical protein